MAIESRGCILLSADAIADEKDFESPQAFKRCEAPPSEYRACHAVKRTNASHCGAPAIDRSVRALALPFGNVKALLRDSIARRFRQFCRDTDTRVHHAVHPTVAEFLKGLV